MNPELELFLIAFVSGAATMLLILAPLWLRYDRNANIQRIIDTAEAFDRGFDLARKQNEFIPHSALAKSDQ